jgi:tetratricopeptide (TPR) repeat protein
MASPNFTNKRIFPRYRLNSDCDLVIAGELFSGKIVDYSVEGIGMVLKDKFNLGNDELELKIIDLGIDSITKIAWAVEMFSGTRLGIRKLGHLTGDLKSFRLSDVLIGIQRLERTGTLYIESSSGNKKVFFKKGDAIFSTTDRESDRMGDMLIQQGKINQEQYRKSSELMLKTGKRHGAALVELGYITPAELIEAVRYQAEKIILDLFYLEDGSFTFKDEPLPNEAVILKLSTGSLIYRGIKTIDDIARIKRHSPLKDSIVYFSSNPLSLFQEIKFSEEDRKVLSLVDGQRSINEIIKLSPLTESETLRIIFALFNTQVIEVIDKGVINPAICADEICVRPETEEEEDPVIADRIEKLHRNYEQLGYYGVLDISRDATIEEIKRAYHKMAREFHPDRHLYFQSESLKEKLNTVFAYINEAYKALSHQKKAHQSRPATAPAEPPNAEQVKNNQELARTRFREGKSYLNRNNYDQALVLFGQAAYLDKSIPDYHFYYGMTLLKNKKIKNAEEAIQKAIQLAPENSDYIAELGHIYHDLGFKTRAKNTFEKALKYDPTHKRALEGLSKIVE